LVIVQYFAGMMNVEKALKYAVAIPPFEQ